MRGVFAVGRFRNKMTLFVSGTGSPTDPNGGYQVTVDEVVDSVIYISQDPEPLPSGIDWLEHSVKFVCSDSTGTYLVTLSSEKAGALSLDNKNFIVAVGGYDSSVLTFCWGGEALHVSSLNLLQFNHINFDKYNGSVPFYFIKSTSLDGTTIRNAEGCTYFEHSNFMGFLCLNGDQVVFNQEKCTDGFTTGIISGFVDEHTVYFFAKDNTVYTFSAKVFQKNGPSAKVIKASRGDAWKGPGDEPPPSKSKDMSK